MQRNTEVPVWGQAGAAETVTVVFRGAAYVGDVDASGRWRVTLPATEAGGPYALVIRSGAETVRLEDVMVGDVWVASGQSNMRWSVANSKDAEAEIAAADDRGIRHFGVPLSWAAEPSDWLAGGAWAPATSPHVGDFTAVGYYFARALRAHVDVPIGIVHTTWGGSRIEAWMSAEALAMSKRELDEALQEMTPTEQDLRDALRAKIGPLPEEDAGLVRGEAHWADPTLDDAAWSTMTVPTTWEQAGYQGMDGVAWYRKHFTLTEEEASHPMLLSLGSIDDNEITWVNGEEVGRTKGWEAARSYEVPAQILRAGKNVIAVRVQDTGGDGGIKGEADRLYLTPIGAAPADATADGPGDRGLTPLAGPWKFKVGAVSVSPSDGNQRQIPTLLYNKMIHPLLPYPITGVLWYQGESNAYRDEAYRYRDTFKRLIESWRERWGIGPFPFLYVQLANYMEESATPSESSWATLRESQSAALSLPKTAQVVAIDIGAADDIHPRNKQDVGRRLARAARKMAYGEDLIYSGPVYDTHRVEEGRIILSFDHTGGGLVARGDRLRGFAIAGEDSTFVWAKARIEGDQVVVESDEVESPIAVRYAWATNPARANLYNEEGLPASPFRTDDWPLH